MPSDLPDDTAKLHQLNAITQALLGCAWGRTVSTPDDTEPCQERADRIVVLHDGPKQVEVRLCARHVDAIIRQSTWHVD